VGSLAFENLGQDARFDEMLQKVTIKDRAYLKGPRVNYILDKVEKKIKRFKKRVLETPDGRESFIAIALTGPPGIGKTSIMDYALSYAAVLFGMEDIACLHDFQSTRDLYSSYMHESGNNLTRRFEQIRSAAERTGLLLVRADEFDQAINVNSDDPESRHVKNRLLAVWKTEFQASKLFNIIWIATLNDNRCLGEAMFRRFKGNRHTIRFELDGALALSREHIGAIGGNGNTESIVDQIKYESEHFKLGELQFRIGKNKYFYMKDIMEYSAYEDSIRNASEEAEDEERPLGAEDVIKELRHLSCEKASALTSGYEPGGFNSNAREMLNSLEDSELKDLVGIKLEDHVSEYLFESQGAVDSAMYTY